MLKFGSLFAGVGGFDLGLEHAGMECAWQVEWDSHCQQVLAHHWPTVPRWGDVREVVGSELPHCDVITFGSPCQDLSVAGKRAGLDGERSGLFHEALRIIKEMRDATANSPGGPFPRIAVWENVPGALTSNKGADFGVVIDSLAELGALAIEWQVLDARWFGVPQRRKRLFVVAIFCPALASACGEEILPVSPRSDWNPPPSGAPWQATATPSSGGAHSTIAAGDNPHGSWDLIKHFRQKQSVFVKSRRAQTADDYETWIMGDVSPTLNVFDNGGETRATVLMPIITDEPIYSFDTQFGSNANVFENQSPTLKASQTSPSISHPHYALRRLTPLECERLMGFPDFHTRWRSDGKEQSDSSRFKQCGNGIAVPVAAWIGKHLVKLCEATNV